MSTLFSIYGIFFSELSVSLSLFEPWTHLHQEEGWWHHHQEEDWCYHPPEQYNAIRSEHLLLLNVVLNKFSDKQKV